MTDNIEEWRRDALCTQTEPEIFFPDKGGSVEDAKSVCDLCSVREQCLEYALKNGERFGVWGGKSERQRRAIEIERGIVRRVDYVWDDNLAS